MGVCVEERFDELDDFDWFRQLPVPPAPDEPSSEILNTEEVDVRDHDINLDDDIHDETPFGPMPNPETFAPAGAQEDSLYDAPVAPELPAPEPLGGAIIYVQPVADEPAGDEAVPRIQQAPEPYVQSTFEDPEAATTVKQCHCVTLSTCYNVALSLFRSWSGAPPPARAHHSSIISGRPRRNAPAHQRPRAVRRMPPPEPLSH
jgi:hypothetical protein